jgi:Ring finger domain
MKRLLIAALLGLGSLQTTTMMTAGHVESEKITECPICWEDFQEGEEVVALPCFKTHLFHHKCLIGSYDGKTGSRAHCPTCREEFLKEDIVTRANGTFVKFREKAVSRYSAAGPEEKREISSSSLVRPVGITQELWDTAPEAEKLFILQSIEQASREEREREQLCLALLADKAEGEKSTRNRSFFEKAYDFGSSLFSSDARKSKEVEHSEKYAPATEFVAGTLVGFLVGREIKRNALTVSSLAVPVSVLSSQALLRKLYPQRPIPGSWQLTGAAGGFVLGYLAFKSVEPMPAQS